MWILIVLCVYFLIGFIISFWFSFFKVHKIDEGAAGAPFGFRLVIIPATVLLWPWVLQKISSSKKYHNTKSKEE
jgi:hypothetical protein